MIKRELKNLILNRLQSFPAVALVGPRQVGKTTLAKTLSSSYFDLELETEKLRLDVLWEEKINQAEIIILDEAQNFPAIFPRLRSAIDIDRKRNGRFLILGSISPALMKEVSEFLTGRIAICQLTPLSISEIESSKLDDLWLRGGYPDGGILKKSNFPIWQQDYLDLLTMRDLPSWGLSAKPQTTQRLFKMLAASNGQLWNASQIGKSLGLSYHTVNTYLDYLEHAYLIRKVPPYHANIKKRLVKSPKIYWRDSGLLHSLLQAENETDLLAQPWVGFSWEGWIIEQILIHLNNRGIQFDGPYFFRTNDSYELDFVAIVAGKLWALEIKLTTNPTLQDIDRLRKTAKLINAQKIALVSRTKNNVIGNDVLSVNLMTLLKIFAQ